MQLRAAIKVPSNTGERSPACLRIHGVQVNEGHKETLLAAGRGREAAAPTAKSSQCLTGPLPEGVAGMISGMLSWVSPPRIHSAPHKIPRLYPSQGSLLLQTPEAFSRANHPKASHGSPQPSSAHPACIHSCSLLCQHVLGLSPLLSLGAPQTTAPPQSTPPPPARVTLSLLSRPEGLLALPGRSGRLLPWGGSSVHRGWLFSQSLEKLSETQLGTACGPVPEEAFELRDQTLYPKT